MIDTSFGRETSADSVVCNVTDGHQCDRIAFFVVTMKYSKRQEKLRCEEVEESDPHDYSERLVLRWTRVTGRPAF